MDAQAYVELASERYMSGDLAGTVEACTRSIELDPERADAYSGRGLAQLGLGDVEAALDDLEQAAELDPEDASIQLNLALALRHADEPEACIAACDRALELGETDVDVYVTRGLARVATEQFAEALDDLTRGLEEEPSANVYVARAEARLQLGESAAAEEDCTRALELDAEHVGALAKRAVARQAQGKEAEGAADHAEAVRLTAEQLTAQLASEDGGERADAIEQLGALVEHEACPDLRPALRSALSDPVPLVRVHAALALHGAGEAGEGLDALRALLADPEPSTRAAAVSGLGFVADQDPDAMALLQGAAEDASPVVRLRVAYTLAELDGEADVVAAIEEALGHPEEAVRLEALKALGALPPERYGDATDRLLERALADPSEAVQAIARMVQLMLGGLE